MAVVKKVIVDCTQGKTRIFREYGDGTRELWAEEDKNGLIDAYANAWTNEVRQGKFDIEYEEIS